LLIQILIKKIEYDIEFDEESQTITINRNIRFGRGTKSPELIKILYKPNEGFEYSFGGIFMKNMLDYDFLIIKSEEIMYEAIFLTNSLFNFSEVSYDDAIRRYTRWTIAKNTFHDYTEHFTKQISKDPVISTTDNIEKLLKEDYTQLFNEPTDEFFKEYFKRIYPAKMEILGYSLSKINILLGVIILFSSTMPGIPGYLRPFLFILGIVVISPYFLKNPITYYLRKLKKSF